MIDKKIRLNLGCGFVYKPGYINVDRFDVSVADIICDVGDLSFKSSSVDLIEAFQLIEHFDYVHCKYILSEWFRVLKPGGILVLETPDLEGSFRKFFSADPGTQKTTMQWIYGIDSSGMQHKSGFSFNLLKDLLGEVGFEKISREKPRTHKYEPGMRVSCSKPLNPLEKQLMACFRKTLKSRLKAADSFILTPLEAWIKAVYDFCKDIEKTNPAQINKLVSKTVICNPLIPLVFLEECVSLGVVEESEIKDLIVLLDHLTGIGFHEKVFSLWIRSRKNRGVVEKEFKDFTSRLESLTSDVLVNCKKHNDRLEYIINLDSVDIDIFDFHIVAWEAKKLFNLGVKHFHKKNFSEALNHFIESSKINPDNPLVYWNMARLECIRESGKPRITQYYKTALNLSKDKGNKQRIESELGYLGDNKINLILKEPVSEDVIPYI